MPKRFTASEKWDDPWFRRLSLEMKLFWIFLLDRCSSAGIWDADLDLAAFYLGTHPTMAEVKNTFDGRIVGLPDGKWFIPKYISFQYGQLSMTNPAHRGAIATLRKYNMLNADLSLIEGTGKRLRSSSSAAKDKEKRKDKK